MKYGPQEKRISVQPLKSLLNYSETGTEQSFLYSDDDDDDDDSDNDVIHTCYEII